MSSTCAIYCLLCSLAALPRHICAHPKECKQNILEFRHRRHYRKGLNFTVIILKSKLSLILLSSHLPYTMQFSIRRHVQYKLLFDGSKNKLFSLSQRSRLMASEFGAMKLHMAEKQKLENFHKTTRFVIDVSVAF